MVAQTRYQERESITVIPLEAIDVHHCCVPHIDLEIPIDRQATRQTQLFLLQHSVRLSRPEIVITLKKIERPVLFTDSALLKHTYPLWLVNGSIQVGELVVRNDPKLGILFERKGEKIDEIDS